MTEIWNTLAKGGIVMIPLMLTSVIALTVIIERAIFLRRRRIMNPDLVRLILHAENPVKLKDSIQSLEHQDSAFINIVRTALEHHQEPIEEIRETIIDQGRREARLLEKGLAILETVAGIAPLLGLLGTVLGMIKVFDVISKSGLGQTQLLSGGISEALITTVVGLSIAIPSLIAYNYFNHKVEDLVLEIEQYSAQLFKKMKLANGD
ncbi:MotA/TolQ/ExbB proton channel family protein [bacterium]|nr:MotA/TolQ/ExbB proton channel family protein [bacterium]